MLNKPRGVVTTLADPEGRPTVLDLVQGVSRRVYPVGRLDFHSEGLLLLTDDGGLARDLMHPSRGVVKVYQVKVRGNPSGETLRRLSRGVTVDGRLARPLAVRALRSGTNTWLEIEVSEGRKHLIRKMLQAVGHPVSRLRRTRYGPLVLGRLPQGHHRPLTAAEVGRLRSAVNRSEPPRRVSPARVRSA
jgi:23S rRNA pseudouridine2605 synthase